MIVVIIICLVLISHASTLPVLNWLSHYVMLLVPGAGLSMIISCVMMVIPFHTPSVAIFMFAIMWCMLIKSATVNSIEMFKKEGYHTVCIPECSQQVGQGGQKSTRSVGFR